ncbi:MAG: hypothetical protein KGI37_08690 [Alphaproteobacteria bacterium]|nr:hypothetical protein [Alphaproteobacteria bacterium]
MMGQKMNRRFDANAGIAIGPILFIIAILAILAAAIAAGSGSFTSGTSQESDKTKASALIQIGENLKVGMDRITMEGGMSPTGTAGPTVVDINAANTNLSNALFSPSGGGVTAPSVGMANDPQTDIWYYPITPVAGFGTSASEVLAVLRVSEGVCAEINNRSTGYDVAPTTGADLGDFTSKADAGTSAPTLTAWPTVASDGVNLVGVATGCVYNTDTASKGYYYYQVLAIQ